MFIPRKHLSLAAFALFCGTLAGRTAPPEGEAAGVMEQSGVQGGFVVHLGSGNGAFTSALRVNDRFQVQGLEAEAATVTQARRDILALGKYGSVCVDEHRGAQLPYIDNLVNLLVAEKLGDVPMKEVLRVLVPNGVAMIKQGGSWKKTVKPADAARDEWTHYYYDALGNATSKDKVVAPPDRLQWVGSPRWSRHHDRMSSLSAQVSAGGRMFYILDEGSRISILLPAKWSLIARDAYQWHGAVEAADCAVEYAPLAAEVRPDRNSRAGSWRWGTASTSRSGSKSRSWCSMPRPERPCRLSRTPPARRNCSWWGRRSTHW